MVYYKLKIQPTSKFVTLPTSDQLFGQICYMLNLMGCDLDLMLKDYQTDPFLVVSDLFPMNYGLKPVIPSKIDNVINIYKLAGNKNNKLKKYVNLDILFKEHHVPEAEESIWKINLKETHHVTINRMTNKAGGLSEDGKISYHPYTLIDYSFESKDNEEFYYSLYLYVKEEYKKNIVKAIYNIGLFGFGGKVSTGSGKYIIKYKDNYIDEKNIDIYIDDMKKIEFDLNQNKYNSIYTLGKAAISKTSEIANYIYYSPYVKFGFHGVMSSNGNPFKNPYVLAEQGLMYIDIVNKNILSKPYIGQEINNISYDSKVKSQGYSLYIPVVYGE